MSFQPLLALNASAGSGKTFQLSVRYVSLLLMGAHPREIYALTFTNKATKEMKERIFSILDNPDSHQIEIDAAIGISGVNKKGIKRKLSHLKKLFLSVEPNIMTIDSFLNKILRTFAEYANIPRNFTISDLTETSSLDAFIRKLYSNGKINDFFTFQEELGTNPKVLVNYLKYLDERSKEIERPITEFLLNENNIANTDDLYDVLSEIEHFGNEIRRLVMVHPNASTSVKKQVQFENAEDLIQKAWMKRTSLNYSTFKKVYSEELDEYFFRLKDAFKKYFSIKEAIFIHELIELYAFYKESISELKNNENSLTFSDVSNIVFELVNSIDNDFIRYRLDSKISHLLIDEFQDTSWLQYKILEPVIQEIVDSIYDESQFKSFFYVGDPKQSIYRFRGGKSTLFNHVSDVFNMDVESLEYNFRSSPEVVEFANNTFKEIFDSNYIPYQEQIAFNDSVQGEVVFNKSLNPIEVVIQEVKELKRKGVKDSQIAVLTFTNDGVLNISESLEAEIEDVVVSNNTNSKIIEQHNVKKILFLLKYLFTDDDFYIKSFMSLEGLNFLESDEFILNNQEAFIKWRTMFDFPTKIIQEIIMEFNLFDSDLNILRFLEISNQFHHLEHILYEFDIINESVVNTDINSGINVMTVHKAKGLEFDYVFVVDSSNRSFNETKYLLFEEMPDNSLRVWHKFSGREFVDAKYADVILREKFFSNMDVYNALYVAFTRAKKSLFLVGLEGEKSKFDLLNLNF